MLSEKGCGQRLHGRMVPNCCAHRPKTIKWMRLFARTMYDVCKRTTIKMHHTPIIIEVMIGCLIGGKRVGKPKDDAGRENTAGRDDATGRDAGSSGTSHCHPG